MKVEFYVLSRGGESERIHKACVLAENAWHKGERVWLMAGDNAQADYIDQALWTFRGDSFVPHERLTDTASTDAPVLVALHAQLSQLTPGVVINLASEPVGACDAASRVVEVLAASDEARAQGRTRYRQYRDAGYQLDTVHA